MEALARFDETGHLLTSDRKAVAASKLLHDSTVGLLKSIPGVARVVETSQTQGSRYYDVIADRPNSEGDETYVSVRVSNHGARPNSNLPTAWSFEVGDNEPSIRNGLEQVRAKLDKEVSFNQPAPAESGGTSTPKPMPPERGAATPPPAQAPPREPTPPASTEVIQGPVSPRPEATPAAVEAAPKEPWQMTREEFRQTLIDQKHEARAKYERAGGGQATNRKLTPKQRNQLLNRKNDPVTTIAMNAAEAARRLSEFDAGKRNDQEQSISDAIVAGKIASHPDYPDLASHTELTTGKAPSVVGESSTTRTPDLSVAGEQFRIAEEWRALAKTAPTEQLQTFYRKVFSAKKSDAGDWLRKSVIGAELKSRGITPDTTLDLSTLSGKELRELAKSRGMTKLPNTKAKLIELLGEPVDKNPRETLAIGKRRAELIDGIRHEVAISDLDALVSWNSRTNP
jgi:hypothetical protein